MVSLREIDAGHKYGLFKLDGVGEEVITFVKREGAKYPGNVGHYPGTNLQEVIRACMARLVYLNDQIPDVCNDDAMDALRDALWALELRAARRHGRFLSIELYAALEAQTFCRKCGHVGCEGVNHEQTDGREGTHPIGTRSGDEV